MPVYKGGGKDPLKMDSFREVTLNTSTFARVPHRELTYSCRRLGSHMSISQRTGGAERRSSGLFDEL